MKLNQYVVYDASMFVGAALVTAGVAVLFGLGVSLIAAGVLVIGLTYSGARR